MTITTPQEALEAAALAVAETEIGHHDGISGDWHPYAGPTIISKACAAIRSIPVTPAPVAAASTEALAAATEAARLLERAEFLAGADAKDAAPHWRQFRQEARAAIHALIKEPKA